MHVAVRLAATRIRYGSRVHEHPGTRTVGVKVVRQRVGKVIADRVVVVRAVAVDSCHEVRMLRQLLNIYRGALRPGPFTKVVGSAEMDRNAATEIRQREIGLSVTTISGSQQRKQRLILIDREELPVGKCPAFRREIETYHSDLG